MSVAALTIYDMCKAVNKTMRLTEIELPFQDQALKGLNRYAVASLQEAGALIHSNVVTMHELGRK